MGAGKGKKIRRTRCAGVLLFRASYNAAEGCYVAHLL